MYTFLAALPVLFLVAQSLKGQVPDLAETYDYFPISSIVVRCYCGGRRRYVLAMAQVCLRRPAKIVPAAGRFNFTEKI